MGSFFQEAPLGLFALVLFVCMMLACSFGVALDHFEKRRELVVTEANALGAAYLCIRMDQPDPLRSATR